MSLTGVLRAENWWWSKLPPLFALAYAQILLLDVEPVRAFVLLFAVLVVTGGSTGAYGHVINDVFDLEVDRKIGKTNRMAGFSPAVRFLVCFFFVVTALTPAFVVPYPMVTTILVGLELLLPALYSIPPVRLKDRGMLGVLADAAGAHVLPALIVMTAFAGSWPAGDVVLLIAAVVWTTCLGLKGILWHQGLDRKDDLRAGATTFAATADPAAVRLILTRYVYPFEVASFSVIVVVLAPAAPLLIVLYLLSIGLDLVKFRLGWSYVFDAREPDLRRRHVPLVSNFFYELGFPLALALHLAIRDARFLVLVALQIVVFFANIKEQLADLRAVFNEIHQRRSMAEDWQRWGWYLDVHPPAAARLAPQSGLGSEGVRVEMEHPGELGWHVKLFRDNLNLVGGAVYRIRFEVRAGRPRSITYCVVAGVEPWESLGLSEGIEVDESWIGVIDRFAASADDAAAEVCFLLGAGDGAVELRSFSFEMEVED